MHDSMFWPVALVAVIIVTGSIPLAAGLEIQENDAGELQADHSRLAGELPALLTSSDRIDRELAIEAPRLEGEHGPAGNLAHDQQLGPLLVDNAGAPINIPGVPDMADVEACQQREDHQRIRITEDHGPQGFTWTNPETGEDEHRPGSGVVAGDGSTEDPFLITGWCIRPILAVLGAGIHIEATSLHVRVVDNAVVASGPFFDEAAVRIEDAANVSLEQNTLGSAEYGIGAWGSDGIEILNNTLRENHLYGVWAAQLENASIEKNTVEDNRQGIGIGLAHGSVVRQNIAAGSENTGIVNAFSDNASIEANQVLDNREAIFVREAVDVQVVANHVRNHSGVGIALDLAPRGIVAENRVDDSGSEGIIFWGSINGTAQGNTVTDSGHTIDRYGIRMAFSADGVVANNTLADNAHGIVLDGTPRGWIADNLVETSTGDGMILWAAEDTTATRNSIESNGIGVRVVEDAAGVRLVGNNIHASQQGVGLNATDANEEVDAQENWWGCAGGPEDPACEDVEGKASYDPWLTTPHPDAGTG